MLRVYVRKGIELNLNQVKVGHKKRGINSQIKARVTIKN